MFYPSFVFSEEQEARIVAAIKAFERRTSGELRVHVEHKLRRPALDEAKRVFERLGMTNTAQRNGVLILIAPGQKAFAIIGDIGIDAVTPSDFWEGAARAMRTSFTLGDYTTGVCEGIRIAGEALATHFPYVDGDVNELPDGINYA